MVEHNCDHLLAPFQCETCHFRNLLGRDIKLSSIQEWLLTITMQRASLDAFGNGRLQLSVEQRVGYKQLGTTCRLLELRWTKSFPRWDRTYLVTNVEWVLQRHCYCNCLTTETTKTPFNEEPLGSSDLNFRMSGKHQLKAQEQRSCKWLLQSCT